MDGKTILTILAAIGGPAGIGALILLLPQVKKLQADTQKVERDSELSSITGATTLSTAALAQMQAAISDAAALRIEVAQMRGELAGMEREVEEHRRLATLHVLWDKAVLDLLRNAGTTVADPPALLPTGLTPGKNGQ